VRRWTEGQTDRQVQVDIRMDGWMDGWVDGWVDGQMEGRIDRRKDGRKKPVFFSLLSLLSFQNTVFAHSICKKPFTSSALVSKFIYNSEQLYFILPTKYAVLNTYECQGL